MKKFIRVFVILFLFSLFFHNFVSCDLDNDFRDCTTTTNDSNNNQNVAYPITFVDDFFDLNSVAEITLKVSLVEWNTLLSNFAINWKNEVVVRADNFIYKNGKGYEVNYENVAFRTRGNTSRRVPEVSSSNEHNKNNPQWQSAHFKISFDKNFEGIDNDYGDRKFADKYDGLILKWFKDDPTFVREIYSYNLFARYGIWIAARVKYAKVYIHIEGDDRPAYFGIYTMLEDFGKNMITQRQQKNIDPDKNKGIGYFKNEGNLWKCTWVNGPASLENVSELDSMIGVENMPLDITKAEPYTYDLKTNKKQLATAKTELKEFIYNLNTKTGNDFKSWISQKMDIDLFLKTYAVNVALGMWDDYWVNPNNYYLYFDTDANKKVYFIPYDYDNTLGVSHILDDSGTQNPLRWGTRDTNKKPLITKILAIPEYEAKYKQYLKELIEPTKDLFYVDKSIARINGWQNLIKDYLNSDIVVVGDNPYEIQTFKAFEDKPAYWANQPKYRLLTGNDSTNFFKAKAKSINQYCN